MDVTDIDAILGNRLYAGELPPPRVIFNNIAKKPHRAPGLALAIRTDAHHATALLKENLLRHIASPPAFNFAATGRPINLPGHVENVVHAAYRDWGHAVLNAMADCLDYSRYGLTDPDRQTIDVHFYNARSLAFHATERSQHLIAHADRELPVVYITLDELIEKQGPNWAEVSFSRLFDLNGTQEGSYMPRPGKQPLAEQIAHVRALVDRLKTEHGRNIPIVLMEDNVRHAKMLNWIIGELDKSGVFENGKLAGISTCFCCATPAERKAIRHKGKIVPVTAVIDYKDAKVDVATPRDLLFDGFVVRADEKTGRLPGIFMDVEKLFKIRPDKVVQFHDMVIKANLKFCETIKDEFGVSPLLSWFQGADAIAHVTGHKPDATMEDVMRAAAPLQAPRLIPPVPPASPMPPPQ